MLSLHRADFQRAILKNLPNNCDTHFHKKLITYDDKEGGPIVLHFADGSTAECDVLIGSDGIKSAVRYTLYQSLATANIITQEESTSPNPIWSGSVAYRGLIPREVLEKQAPIHRTLNSQVMVSAYHASYDAKTDTMLYLVLWKEQGMPRMFCLTFFSNQLPTISTLWFSPYLKAKRSMS